MKKTIALVTGGFSGEGLKPPTSGADRPYQALANGLGQPPKRLRTPAKRLRQSEMPLRHPADFARFAGHKADVRMRTPDATGRRRFVGVLRGAEGSRVTIELEGRRVQLELGDVERARLVPEL